MFSDVENIENNAKLQNWSNYNELLLFDVKTIKTTQNFVQTRSNYDQFASIWHQNNPKCWDTSKNIQYNAKLRKWSNYSALHRFDVKTIRNVQWHRKYWNQCKTTKLIKVQRIASLWCQNDQNNSKLQTRSNYDQFASIWHQNNQKCWDTSKNIQYNANQRKWSNYNALHRFDVKTI